MEQKMTERAKKIMKAYEAEDTYNFPNDGVAAALRKVVEELKYIGITEKNILELADELEAL
jgi:DNA-binding transcriptional regulator YhcF (GntR family)